MLLAVFIKITFTAFFRQKILDRKVDKNDLIFNKQYVKKKTHFEKNVDKNVKNIKIEVS